MGSTIGHYTSQKNEIPNESMIINVFEMYFFSLKIYNAAPRPTKIWCEMKNVVRFCLQNRRIDQHKLNLLSLN